MDWIFKSSNTAEKPDWIGEMMLSAMTPAPNLKEVLVRWSIDLKSAFPEHSESLSAYFQGLSQERVHALRTKAKPEFLITRQALRRGRGRK